MKFSEIWKQLCRKQPSLEVDDEEVVFKSRNLRALLKQVYKQGQKSAQSKVDPFSEMFGSAFRR